MNANLKSELPFVVLFFGIIVVFIIFAVYPADFGITGRVIYDSVAKQSYIEESAIRARDICPIILKADVNADRRIDYLDQESMSSHMIEGLPKPVCFERNADIDEDGSVSRQDISYLESMRSKIGDLDCSGQMKDPSGDHEMTRDDARFILYYIYGYGLSCCGEGKCDVNNEPGVDLSDVSFVLENYPQDSMIGSVDLEKTLPSCGYQVVRGDVNKDSGADSSDAVAIAEFLFSSRQIECLEMADINADHKVTVEDVFILLM
jgi:hypothetical protein